MHKKKKLSLRTETVAALSSDSIQRVRGGLCNESLRNTDQLSCFDCDGPVYQSCGYCVRG